MRTKAAILTVTLLLVGAPAWVTDAQDGAAMPGMSHGMPMGGAAGGPAAEANQAAMQQMMQGMATPSTGDPDVDFARGMIPHHQGAIAMAKIELQYGKDPQLRQLAQDIIAAQEAEIAVLQAWLAKAGR